MGVSLFFVCFSFMAIYCQAIELNIDESGNDEIDLHLPVYRKCPLITKKEEKSCWNSCKTKGFTNYKCNGKQCVCIIIHAKDEFEGNQEDEDRKCPFLTLDEEKSCWLECKSKGSKSYECDTFKCICKDS